MPLQYCHKQSQKYLFQGISHSRIAYIELEYQPKVTVQSDWILKTLLFKSVNLNDINRYYIT